MRIYWFQDPEPTGISSSIGGYEAVAGWDTTSYKVWVDVCEDDSSYRYRGLMEQTLLQLKFSLPCYVDIPVGAQCDYMGQTYTSGTPADFKKHGSRNYEYTLNMGTDADHLSYWKLRNSVDGRLKFSMCAKPHEYLEEIVANLNQKEGSNLWSVGDYVDATEKTVEFSHAYISDALQSVASAFDTEYEIDAASHRISLCKIERLKDNPLPLSYGCGNGFVPGLGRASVSDEKPIKRLYTEGTDRNIDRSEYGSSELHLPLSQSLRFDGQYFDTDLDDDDSPLIDESKAHTYTTDADGTSIMRTDTDTKAVKEDSLDCSEIYPSRVGRVMRVDDADVANNLYDIADLEIPADLDFSECIIEGETMTIIFQSGMLAGKEFDVIYHHTKRDASNALVPDRRFEIVPQEYDGQMMPNETYKPSAANGGDTYAVFGIQLPQAYICDNDSKTGASWDMFREAAKWLYEHEQQKFTFSGELQGIWAKSRWAQVSQYMEPGAYIHFTDEHFAPEPEGVDIRIVGIKEYLTKPYSPQIEISNTISAASSTSQRLRDMEATEAVIKNAERNAITYTKRRFKDAKETAEMLQNAIDSLAGGYTESVSPISVQTMQMLVGDEALQFHFVNSADSTARVADTMSYEQSAKRFKVSEYSVLMHMTLGIDNISSSHAASEYRRWGLNPYTSPILIDPDKAWYVYAQCVKSGPAGSFTISETALDLEGTIEGGTECYNFLCGIINREIDGERSFVRLYGYTEILPGRITTDRIVSADGDSWLDLVAGAFRLGSSLRYNTDGTHTLLLKGAVVQSPSGDEFYVPCYRGNYSSTEDYYAGDTVTYDNGKGTSTYICVRDCNGIVPTNTTYWQLSSSQGTNGRGLNSITQSWMLTSSNTAPAASSDGWQAPAPEPTEAKPYLWAKSIYDYSDGTANVEVVLCAVRGRKGDTGPSPAMIFRGDYSSTEQYYGYSKRLDVVRYNGIYWIAVLNDTLGSGGFSGQTPGSSSTYWANFGTSFSSVATMLLLAEMANVGGWVMKDNRLISQIGTIRGEISNDYAADNFIPAIILDAVNGEIWQGENLLVNGDGLTLFDSNGNVAAKVVNETIGAEADLSATSDTVTQSDTNQSATLYNPTVGTSVTTTFSRTVELGYYSNGSTLRIDTGAMNFTLPASQNSSATMTYQAVSFRIEVLRGWTVVKTIAMTSSGTLSIGSGITGSYNGTTTISIDGSTYIPGQYRIRVCCNLAHTSTAAGSAVISDMSYSCKYYYNKTSMQKTLIGSDGMYSCWGNLQYFFADSNGIVLRHGNYGLKISSAGIQKMTDGTNYSAL